MKTFKKKWITRTITFFLLGVIIAGCGKEDEPGPQVIAKSNARQITSFVFLINKNAIANNVVGIIDEENKTITATMPAGTNITGLLPDIEIPETASINPNTAQNFTTPIKYTVTAEDGSQVIYTATVKVDLTQRQILQAILDANPDTTLDWNLSGASDLGTLSGVETNSEGTIIKLVITLKNITQIPPEIGQLTNLSILYIPNNKITTLPAEIGQLTRLTALSLNSNKLTTLPPEIGQLTKLEEVGLINNLFSTLPSEISQLKNLKKLYLQENKLSSFPPGMEQLTRLEILHLAGNKLKIIPDEIGQLVNLRGLYFYENDITILSAEVGQLKNLHELDLGSCKLTSLPPEIGFLKELDEFIISGNPLTVIPQSICNLKDVINPDMRFFKDNDDICTTTSQTDALISIYSSNRGNTLEWGVNNFPGVTFNDNGSPKHINIGNKKLTRLPDGIGQFTDLETLAIGDNTISHIPSAISNLKKLTVVGAGTNLLKTVPSSMSECTNLALLGLENNPLTGIPKSVCDLQVSNGGILSILTDPGEGCNE